MSRTRKLKCDEGTITVTFVNPGQWFKRRWLVGVGAGFSCLFYIIEADTDQDALDELVDSEWGHIVKSECDHEDKEDCIYAGNYGDHVDFDDIRVLRRLYAETPKRPIPRPVNSSHRCWEICGTPLDDNGLCEVHQ